jgi:hypothetical protein
MISKSLSHCFVNRHAANPSPRLFPRPEHPPGAELAFREGEFWSPVTPLSPKLRSPEDSLDVSIGFVHTYDYATLIRLQ